MSHIWPFNVQFIWYYVYATGAGINESPLSSSGRRTLPDLEDQVETMCQYDLGAIFIMTFTDFTDYRVISHGRCLSDKSASVVFGRDENVQLFEKVI